MGKNGVTSLKTHSIKFSTGTVCKLLAGSKTQTRRLILVKDPMGIKSPITSPTEEILEFEDGSFHYRSTAALSGPYKCPYGNSGGLLWVREAYRKRGSDDDCVQYRASTTDADHNEASSGWLPWEFPNNMPRRLSRLTLHVATIGAERLCSISEEDARAEGYKDANAFLAGPWASLLRDGNPWVWKIKFTVLGMNVDTILKYFYANATTLQNMHKLPLDMVCKSQ